MEVSGSLESASFLISSLLLLDELGSLGGSRMESRRRRLLGKEDSCSGMINLKKQQLWVKEIGAVQDIPSAAEVAETIFHAPGCCGNLKASLTVPAPG